MMFTRLLTDAGSGCAPEGSWRVGVMTFLFIVFFLKIYLFLCRWWVFVAAHGLSLVAACGLGSCGTCA